MEIRWLRGTPFALLLFSLLVYAQTNNEDEDTIEEITVSGMRVTAGGAQDIAFARSEILSGRIPHPDTITDEGLLSQHDLTLSSSAACEQLFCVFGEAIRSNIVNKPNDRYFVGLGFSTDIEPDDWTRQPQNIVAVVDKSGSMNGAPLALVRRSLLALTSELTNRDQLSIVLYGDRSHVYLEPTRISRNSLRRIRGQIRAIESSGSTNMEDGLRVGYLTARESRAAFNGATRLILFTDERPNVGDTSADGFVGMANAASNLGIGLTTIGVGVQFDSVLATELSSTRGGNLFFLPDEKAANRIFHDEFEFMVSELAHDLTFVIRPHSSLQITGVYGLPGDRLSWSDDRSVTFTVPTVFLSSRGGGVFVSLAPVAEQADLPPPRLAADTNVLAVGLTYTPVGGNGAPESASSEVAQQQRESSRQMQLASVLVDEYLGLRLAATEHYIHNNQEGAYQALRLLDNRLSNIDDKRIRKIVKGESEMIAQLLDKFAFLSGHMSEISSSTASRLWGAWRIITADTDDYYDELEAGHLLLFSPDNRVAYVGDDDYSDLDWDDSESYVLTKSGLLFLDSDMLFKHRLRKNKLTLRYRNRVEDVNIRIELEYAGPFPLDRFAPRDLN